MAQDTKARILDCALKLFNSEGIDHVTIRDVAEKVGISHGNLCYHFPNIESLVENLYKRLVAEMDEQFRQMTGQEISFSVLHASSAATFRRMYAYKFLMLDFVRIMRKSKHIRQHYQQLYRLRKDQFRMILGWMQQEAYLKPEGYAGQYENVVEQLFIIGDFWIASAEILYEGKEKDKITHYADIVNQVLIPYFTDKGLLELIKVKV